MLKSIEFDESQLGDLQAIANELFRAPDDPRCYGYKRILIRPRINWLKIALNCLIPVLASWVIYFILCQFGMSGAVSTAVALAAFLLCLCVSAKRAVICLVHIYQRYAPDSVRNKCRFEPSCSQYMILSLQKYGLCKGLAKGIRRLKRCNVDDGGFDFP